MTKFRKRPIVVEAWKNLERNAMPVWVLHSSYWLPKGRLLIKTLEGVMIVEAGDWIIRGISAEIYSCKPDIFEATYEQVEDPADAPADD